MQSQDNEEHIPLLFFLMLTASDVSTSIRVGSLRNAGAKMIPGVKGTYSVIRHGVFVRSKVRMIASPCETPLGKLTALRERVKKPQVLTILLEELMDRLRE